MPVSPPGPDTRVYQPAELNREVRLHLEAGFPRLWISGEISNLARPASGHLYFTLKDARAQVRCALFRGQDGNVAARPENGDQVLIRGRLSLFEPRGDYQLIADALLPAGAGALQQAFEALKNKLDAEGLFDPAAKRPLPRFPKRIGVVTSASGAAVRDIRTTLARRWPAAEVLLYPTAVQGEQAVPEILAALDRAAREARAEVLILARGGGSIEDLWAFNDERVARRLRTLPMPVVTGVGHETDFTIADFAADLRAATPTAAAEAVTPDGPALKLELARRLRRLEQAWQRRMQQHWQRLDGLEARLARQHPARRLDLQAERAAGLQRRLHQAVARRLATDGERLRGLASRLRACHPGRRVGEQARQLDGLGGRLRRAITVCLAHAGQRLAATARALDAVSPLAVLGRGYALIEDDQGRVLSRREDFSVGQTLRTRVRDLRLLSTLEQIDRVRPEPDADGDPDPDG